MWVLQFPHSPEVDVVAVPGGGCCGWGGAFIEGWWVWVRVRIVPLFCWLIIKGLWGEI